MNLLTGLKKIMNSDPQASLNMAENTYHYEMRQRELFNETLKKMK